METKVTCNKCGRVHFYVTRKYAEEQVAKFNDFYDSLDKEKQNDYYGGKCASIKSYEHCMRCGNVYKDFREYKNGDCPDGCTIGPIIMKTE
jgi:ribosomal protein L37E